MSVKVFSNYMIPNYGSFFFVSPGTNFDNNEVCKMYLDRHVYPAAKASARMPTFSRIQALRAMKERALAAAAAVMIFWKSTPHQLNHILVMLCSSTTTARAPFHRLWTQVQELSLKLHKDKKLVNFCSKYRRLS